MTVEKELMGLMSSLRYARDFAPKEWAVLMKNGEVFMRIYRAWASAKLALIGVKNANGKNALKA